MSSESIRVFLINRNYSGPAERVRLVTCRLTCDYPTKEFRLYCLLAWQDLIARDISNLLENLPDLNNFDIKLSKIT